MTGLLHLIAGGFTHGGAVAAGIVPTVSGASALGLALAFAPPPPPPTDPDGDPTNDASASTAGSPSAPPPNESPAGDPPPGKDDKSAATQPPGDPSPKPEQEVDAWGRPILPHGEAGPTAADLVWADEAASDPGSELVWAEEGEPRDPEGVSTATTPDPPAPPEEAVARDANIPPPVKRRKGRRFDGRFPNESPQRFAVELKFGPYVPAVDVAYRGAGFGPYATVFGRTNGQGVSIDEPQPGLFSAVAFDWQFLYLAGPVSVGTSLGIFRDRADAILAVPAEDGQTRSTADQVAFGVVPITLSLGWRFELLADYYKVPIVPYAKAGLGVGFWWSRRGDGKLSVDSSGQKGRGGSIGWHATLGGMLRLDFLERGGARELDRQTGINHTYLFGEWQFSRLDGFGGRKVSVGDDTWLVGLAMEF